MREEEMVSLWVGHVESSNALDAYMVVGYSEDGDFIPSPFAKDFGIGYYDDDFREAQYYQNPSRSVRDLLRGYSYNNMIIPKFVQLLGELLPEEVNAVVLLYNFKHDNGVVANAGETVRLRYVGTVSFEVEESKGTF